MMIEARSMTTPQPSGAAIASPGNDSSRTISLQVDGQTVAAHEGELLLEAVLRTQEIPHVCYHSPLMGSIQSCDTCLVEVNGELVRACGCNVASGLNVVTQSARATA